jgi:hypothetical protein
LEWPVPRRLGGASRDVEKVIIQTLDTKTFSLCFLLKDCASPPASPVKALALRSDERTHHDLASANGGAHGTARKDIASFFPAGVTLEKRKRNGKNKRRQGK